MPLKIHNGVDANWQRIQNLADGSAPGDAVTKAQLDAAIRGLDWKQSVRVATTTNITLSGTQTIDSVAVVAGDRVLVKDQTSAAANGIYVVAAGAWSRAVDFDEPSEVTAAAAISVEAGTTNGDAVFILTTDGPITIGSTALAFTRLGGSGGSYTPGNGLTLSGAQFSLVVKAAGGLVVDGTGVYIDVSQLASLGITRKYAANVPNGSTTATLTHNLGTLDVAVTIYEVSTGAEVYTDVVAATTNTVTITFATAPTSGQYRAVIFG